MAKHRHSTALARPNVIVMRPPGRVRRAARRAAPHLKRHARRIGGGVKRALPTTGVALGALVVGYLDGKGFMDRLPQIGGSKVITLGVAGYALTRFVKNPMVRNAGLAALAAAAFDFGRVQGGKVSGFEDVSGDAGAGPHSGQGY
jgi:hypothetical protein